MNDELATRAQSKCQVPASGKFFPEARRKKSPGDEPATIWHAQAGGSCSRARPGGAIRADELAIQAVDQCRDVAELGEWSAAAASLLGLLAARAH